MTRILRNMTCAATLLLSACGGARVAADAPAPMTASVLFSPYDVRSASFTADGQTVYFVVKIAEYRQALFVAQRHGRMWGAPQDLPFSGNASQGDPFITPDGSALYFTMRQQGRSDLDIMVAHKSGATWSEPAPVGGDVNTDADESAPWLAPSGRLYFASSRSGGVDLFVAEPVTHGFAHAQSLGVGVNSDAYEYQPSVSSDETVLVFTGLGRPDETHGRGALYNRSDLYISRKQNGVWGPARPLPAPINSEASELAPAFSADGLWFSFVSERFFNMDPDTPLEHDALLRGLGQARNGGGDVYRVPVSALGARQ